MCYPSTGSVSSNAQLGGVLMGRVVAAQQFFSTMDSEASARAGIYVHHDTESMDEVFVYQVADQRYPNQRAPIMVSKSMGMGRYYK